MNNMGGFAEPLDDIHWDATWTDLAYMGSRNLAADEIEYGHRVLEGEPRQHVDPTCGCPRGKHSSWCVQNKGRPVIEKNHWCFLKNGDVAKCNCERGEEHME